MNTDSRLTLLVAVCCIVALGVSATTLQASVSTKPNQVINVNSSSVPIGNSQLSQLKRQLHSSSKPTSHSSSHSSHAAAHRAPAAAHAHAQSSGPRGAGGGSALSRPSLLDRLLALLRTLLYVAAPLLAAALAYRYRERILAFLDALRESEPAIGSTNADRRNSAPRESYGVGPSNPVYRTWLEMTRLAGVDDPESRTPGECASVAIDDGLDPTAVRTLTREFEAVRYGEAAVTPNRLARVGELHDTLVGERGGASR